MVSILISFILFIIAIYDIKSRRIPNYLVILLFLCGIIALPFSGNITEKLLGIIIPSAAFLLFYKINFMGAGDIKLFSALGLFLGYQINILIFIFSIFLAFAFSLIKKLFKPKSRLSSSVPYAPFVFISYMILLSISFLYK